MEQRLIDANKVMDKMRNTFDMQELYLPIHFKELITDELPTVDAIPVEWLKKKLTNHPELSYAITDGINNVLDLWEEEQANEH